MENSICQSIWGCIIVLWILLIVILFFVDIVIALIGFILFIIYLLLFPFLCIIQAALSCLCSDQFLFLPLGFCFKHNIILIFISKTMRWGSDKLTYFNKNWLKSLHCISIFERCFSRNWFCRTAFHTTEWLWSFAMGAVRFASFTAVCIWKCLFTTQDLFWTANSLFNRRKTDGNLGWDKYFLLKS